MTVDERVYADGFSSGEMICFVGNYKISHIALVATSIHFPVSTPLPISLPFLYRALSHHIHFITSALSPESKQLFKKSFV